MLRMTTKQINPEFRPHHTSRHLAKHSFELDDKIYGSPNVKETVDRAISDPRKYIEELKEEKRNLLDLRSDVAYFANNYGGQNFDDYKEPQITISQANAHVFHKFTVKSFTYASKIQSFLSAGYMQMNPNIPKLRRQINVLDAALEDITVSIIRFEKYAELIS